MSAIYEQFGVRPVINGVGPATRLGGMVMEPEVLAAMAEAAGCYVRIDELQEAAGRTIAEITGAEAAYVTPGAAAGLALSTAACMAGLDPSKVNRLPNATGMKNEVAIHRTHRYDYDHAIRSVGATLVEFGFPDSVFPYELDEAIGPQTAAVAYYPSPNRPALPLAEVVAIAHRRGVPVIVDAALEVPPAENLRAYAATGADLVVYSGGKAIGGPQASGFVCGRADLIQAIAFQHQDMDVHPETWPHRDLIAQGTLAGPPHHGIGRSMKVGKEEVVGLLVALRRFQARDHAAERARWQERAVAIRDGLIGLPHVSVEVAAGGREPQSAPVAVVRLDETALGLTAWDVLNALQEGEPRIFLNEERAWQGAIVASPMTLRDDDVCIVVDRLRQILDNVIG